MAGAYAAPQVLFLSPDEESRPVGHDGDRSYDNNAFNAFNKNATVTQLGGILDKRNTLTDPPPPDYLDWFKDIKLVVLTTTYAKIDPLWMPKFNDLMLNRPDLTFVMFPDSCCNQNSNADPLLNIMKAGTGWSLGTTSGESDTSMPLNTNSLYKDSFAGLPKLEGGAFEYVTNVPVDNALYLHQGATAPTQGKTDAYGFFVPQQGFNSGSGSCVFYTTDVSPFQNASSGQHQALADAFVNAATDSNGACKQATRTPDLTVELTGPSTLNIGAAGSFSVIIGNQGASESTDGTVSIALPSGFTASGFPANCSVAGSNLTCTLSKLAATSGTSTITFQGQAQQAGNISLVATITGVTDETNTSNNSYTLVLQIPPQVGPSRNVASVPSLSGWALGLLAVLLAATPVLRRRK